MIEIKKPIASGGLTYPIKQATIDLSNANFTTLSTAPLEILPVQSPNYLFICNMAVQFENITYPVGYIMYISFEITQYQLITFNNTMNALTGCQTMYTFQGFSGGNTFYNQRLVLISASNNGLVQFNKFFVTINYIELPNLI